MFTEFSALISCPNFLSKKTFEKEKISFQNSRILICKDSVSGSGSSHELHREQIENNYFLFFRLLELGQ